MNEQDTPILGIEVGSQFYRRGVLYTVENIKLAIGGVVPTLGIVVCRYGKNGKTNIGLNLLRELIENGEITAIDS